MKNKKYLSIILAVIVAAAALYFSFAGGGDKNGAEETASKTAAEIESETAEQTGTEAETAAETAAETEAETAEETRISEDGKYYSKDEVALYINTYGHLPQNYMTKKEAEKLGWSGGSLEKYAPGKVIGGDSFGNYEGLLPSKKGRTYTECDIDTYNAARGAKRIVFSNDGLIYYSEDHYGSFTLLYGDENQ